MSVTARSEFNTETNGKRACVRRCCIWFKIAAGILSFTFGSWVLVQNFRFSSLYEDIRCLPHQPALIGTDASSWRLQVVATCTNPNAYDIEILPDSREELYIGEDKSIVASTPGLQPAVLYHRGVGTVAMDIDIDLGMHTASSLIGHTLFNKPTSVYFTSKADLEIHIDFFFTSFSFHQTFDKQCGFKFDKFGKQKSEVVCADSHTDLQLLDTMEPTHKEIVIRADPEDLKTKTRIKSVVLILVACVGFALGLAAIAHGMLRLRKDRILNTPIRPIGTCLEMQTFPAEPLSQSEVPF